MLRILLLPADPLQSHHQFLSGPVRKSGVVSKQIRPARSSGNELKIHKVHEIHHATRRRTSLAPDVSRPALWRFGR
jgi:hypothetical protein